MRYQYYKVLTYDQVFRTSIDMLISEYYSPKDQKWYECFTPDKKKIKHISWKQAEKELFIAML